jgi:branched-chain amino acid transport system permease protein
MSTFGNLIVAGITSGAIYAVIAACVTIWFRVCRVLNLAVGDFAMVGAIGAAELAQSSGLSTPLAIVVAIAAAAVIAWLFDWVVLHPALDGKRGHSGVVAVFFYTFALSFILEGIAKIAFGTEVHAAPAVWPGAALSAGGIHVQRAAILVIALAAISGAGLFAYLRYTVSGKAASASGESVIGARIVGIDGQRLRRRIFIATAMLAALFGVLESPITGYLYNSGPTISLVGVIAAGFAGFRHPGRAVLYGLALGIIESLLGGYVSTEYNEVLLYGLMAVVILAVPQVFGFREQLG